MPDDSPLTGPWKAYRTWACTSAYHKGIIDSLTTRSLWLGIAGAVLATLGQQLSPHAPQSGMLVWLFKAPGVLGAGFVALAGYLGTQALGENRVRAWSDARTAAESLKSGIILYRVSAPPFDRPDKATQLVSRVDKVLDTLKTAEARPPDDKPAPPAQMTLPEYISDRVDQQTDWYEKRAKEHQAKADQFRQATFVLGIVSTLLALTTIAAVAAWAAVVATAISSITAHLKNHQYQTLAATYQGTALRLRMIKFEWTGSGKTDADKQARNLFIQRCEDTMASENGAWAALWTKKNDAST